MGRVREKLLNLFIFSTSVLVAFLMLEAGARLYKKEYYLKNFPVERIDLLHSAYPTQYDSSLGWIPKVGFSGKNNPWKTQVTIIENGVRSNGKGTAQNVLFPSGAVLAVGDSFTFGADVSDNETWPAQLENILGEKVINAGVFGYGLDQTFLRAKSLMKTYKPRILIFGFIPSDIGRCQMSERTGVAKPYFEASNGSLSLKNVPAPLPKVKPMDAFRKIAGYSFLIHYVMDKKFPEYWYQGSWQNTEAHKDGEKISCLLLRELAQVAKANNVRQVIIVVQYTVNGINDTEDLAKVDRILNCVNRESAEVIDLRYPLSEALKQDKKNYYSLFKGHMSPEGNYFVASEIKKLIDKSAD